MNIALASDEGYVQHLAAVLASFLAHAADTTTPNVYVLSNGISGRSVERLRQLQSIHPHTLHMLEIDQALYDGCPITRHTVTTYFRLRLPELLPRESKVIYLDCDVIVQDSLEDLWKLELGRAHYAACPDAIELVGSPQQRESLRRGGDVYFNTGVLLLNLDAMRRDRTESRVLDWLCHSTHDKPILYPDQDALNVLHGDRAVRLPLRWNFQLPLFDRREFLEQDPAVLHYTTQNKPWKYSYSLSFGDQYWSHLELTPWRSAVPQGKAIIPMLKKAARRFIASTSDTPRKQNLVQE